MDITCIVLDDEPGVRSTLSHLLLSNSGVDEVLQASDANEALEMIAKREIHLIFVDIQMPGQDGFEFVESLMRIMDTKQIPLIVFATAYDEYAVNAVRFAALDYLLKPFSPKDVHQVVLKAKSKIINSQKQVHELSKFAQYIGKTKIEINTVSGVKMLNPKDILYAAFEEKYTYLYLSNGHKERIITTLKNFVEEQAGVPFFYLERSLAINCDNIYEVHRGRQIVALHTETGLLELPIRTKKTRELMQMMEN